MARAVLGKTSAERRAPASITRLDRDRPLVDAARRDPAHFDALYRRYLARVYSFAFYELRDHHEAEDATERTFLAALANLDRFRERARRTDPDGASTFRVWLFRIARNVISNQHRHRRRHPTAPLETAEMTAAPGDLATGVARHEEAASAWRAIGRLPTDRRRAVILRFIDEMSAAEIGAVLGRSEGAVRVLLHRALRSVARELGSRGTSEANPQPGETGRANRHPVRGPKTAAHASAPRRRSPAATET